MGNLASTDKVVTAEMLQAYHDEHVAPFLGGNVLGAQSRFKQSDIYSTSERIVGCWTDGRPLYQKVFTGNLPSSSGYLTVAPSDTREIIYAYGWVSQPGGWSLFMNYNSDNSTDTICLAKNSDYPNQLYVSMGNNSKSQPAVIVLQYTKTTDAAGSYYLAGENDYSTDEKIISTWIDGKPIYRKVYTGITGAISGSGETLIVLDVSYRLNGKKIINARGGLNYDVSSSDYGRVILPWYVDATNYAMIQDSTARGLVICARGNFFSNSEYAVAVEYTKS